MIRTEVTVLLFFFCLFYVNIKVTHATNLETFCNPDSAVPDDLIHCGSCLGRCGSESSVDSSSRPICNCDRLCLLYGDCCHDFKETCFRVFVDAYAVKAPFSQQFGNEHFKCVSDILVLATCSNGSACVYSDVLNDDVNTFVPMYDVTKNVHYISGYCAVCNGAFNVFPWDVSLRCSRFTDGSWRVFPSNADRSTSPPPKYPIGQLNGSINSTQSFNQVRQSASCSLSLNKPNTTESRRCVPPVISSCRSTCHNQELITKCLSSSSEYTYLGAGLNELYRNPFCAICGEHSSYTTADLACVPRSLPAATSQPHVTDYRSFPSSTTGHSLVHQLNPNRHYIANVDLPIDAVIPSLESFSLTVVFDFDPRRGLAIGEQGSHGCDPGEAFHLDEGVCRTITCPSGLTLEGNTCVPEVSAIVVIVDIIMESSTPSNAINTTTKNREPLQSRLLVITWNLLLSHAIDPIQLQVKLDFQIENNNLKTTTTLRCNCDYSELIVFDNIGEDADVNQEFREHTVKVVRETVLGFILRNGVKPNRISAEFHIEKQNTSFGVQQADCVWIAYGLHETKVTNSSVEIISTGKTFGPNSFEVLNDTVIVCEIEGEDTIPFALGILTIVCIGLSLVCLLIRILLQFCVTIFATRPGKLQFNLTTAFLLAFVFLVIAPLTRDNHAGCVVSAVVLCYGFLASFTWMNVIALDTWLAFRPSAAFVRPEEKVKSLWRHVLIGWGFPMVFVAIAIGVDYSKAKITYRPNFGGLRCWFTQRIALLTYFGLPIAISIMLNICLYILTTLNLRRAFKDKKSRKTQQKEHHFLVYVRLFVLMGFTWIFGFLSAFTDEVAIDFVFVILTSLQGVFLFVSFVCNKRVLNELREKTKTGKMSHDKRSLDMPLEKKNTLPDAPQNGKSGSKEENSTEKENDARNESDKGKEVAKFKLRSLEPKNKKGATERMELRKPKKALMPNLERSRESIKDRIFTEIRRNLRKKSSDKSDSDDMTGIEFRQGKRESVA